MKNMTARIRTCLIILIIGMIACVCQCTIGVSHKVIINEYGDTDTAKTNKKFINNINFVDTTKTKNKK